MINKAVENAFYAELEKIAAPGVSAIGKRLSPSLDSLKHLFMGKQTPELSRKIKAALASGAEPALEGAVLGTAGTAIALSKKELPKLLQRITSTQGNLFQKKPSLVASALYDYIKSVGPKSVAVGTGVGIKRGFSAGRKSWLKEAARIETEKARRGAIAGTGAGITGLAGLGAILAAL